jgi:hypothetical protein
MIKDTELRKGNLVIREDLGNREPRIESILELREEKAVTSGPIKVICGYDELDPIPITEEWLLKFGFEVEVKEVHTYYLKDYGDFFFTLAEASIGYWHTRIRNHRYDHESFVGLGVIKYLHSLQNMFFALTGEELTIKDPVHSK